MATPRKTAAADKPTKSPRAAKRAPRSSAEKKIDPAAQPPAPAAPEPTSEVQVVEDPAPPPAPSGIPMTPEPSPAPAPATAPPAEPAPAPAPAQQWAPVPDEPAPPKEWVTVPDPAAVTPTPPGPETTERREPASAVTTRRGTPWLIALGAIIAALGLIILLYAYYLGYLNGELPSPAGIRADILAVLLLILGVGVAVAFVFLPQKVQFGLGANASRDDLESEIRISEANLRLRQAMVGLGLGLVALGLLIMIYYVRLGFLEEEFRSSIVAGYDIPTHYLGAIPLLVGLLILMFFWGGVHSARHRHNLATLASRRVTSAPAAPLAPNMMSSGVSEEEVQNLMRRLDGLMAQLPDTAVTEFSKTPEADTYLKLLGS